MDWRVNDQTILLDTQIKMKKYRCERGDATTAFKQSRFFLLLFIRKLQECCVCVRRKNCEAIRFDFDISQRIKIYTFRIESNDRKIYAISLLANQNDVQCTVFFFSFVYTFNRISIIEYKIYCCIIVHSSSLFH